MKYIYFWLSVFFSMLAIISIGVYGCGEPEITKGGVQPVTLTIRVKSDSVPETHFCKSIEVKGAKRAVGSFGRYWPGKEPTLTVRFLNKNATREAHFKNAALEWQNQCGLKFTYVTTGKADIRVRFDDGNGSWSYIGTDAKSITGATTATLNVGWDGLDVALHELGHAIGLQHEQSNPNKGICWNEQNVIKSLSGPPNNWSLDQIKFNVFAKSDPATVNATDWDANSIMQYSIPASWVCDGKAIPGGKILSEQDKKFIAGAYPVATPTTVTITPEQRRQILKAADEIKSILQ